MRIQKINKSFLKDFGNNVAIKTIINKMEMKIQKMQKKKNK